MSRTKGNWATSPLTLKKKHIYNSEIYQNRMISNVFTFLGIFFFENLEPRKNNET